MPSIYDQPPPPSQPGQPLKPAMTNPFDAPGYTPQTMQSGPEPPRKKSGCSCVGCLLGCLGIVLVMGILAGVGTWYAVKKAPDWTRGFIDTAVQSSDLTPEDKQVVMAQVDRLVDGYKQGKVDVQKLAQFGDRFMKSPLMDLMIAYAAKVKYIDPSGLTDEEKAEAEKVLHRVARGVVEEKIDDDDLDVALNHISNDMGNGGRQFREKVSDEELRAFIKECKRLADEANIPEGEFKVDIGAELKKLVDETLGEAVPAEAPPPDEAPPASDAPPANEFPAPNEVPSPNETPQPNETDTPNESPPAEKPGP